MEHAGNSQVSAESKALKSKVFPYAQVLLLRNFLPISQCRKTQMRHPWDWKNIFSQVKTGKLKRDFLMIKITKKHTGPENSNCLVLFCTGITGFTLQRVLHYIRTHEFVIPSQGRY